MSTENPQGQTGLLWHPEGKTGWCPELRYPQEPWEREARGGESVIAEVTARMGLNLQELSFTEPGSAGPKQPWFSGEHHFLVHSASLMKTYSSEENPSPRLQLRSNTQTRCSNYHRQNISTLGKMGIK